MIKHAVYREQEEQKASHIDADAESIGVHSFKG
jgi:hypothetical protein